MDINKATEIAYNNGYKKGSEDMLITLSNEIKSFIYDNDNLIEQIDKIVKQYQNYIDRK